MTGTVVNWLFAAPGPVVSQAAEDTAGYKRCYER